tara:strand:- start:7978 stop:10254 length:2277 start_codon:yes stop_codon:yes gene_type:complete
MIELYNDLLNKALNGIISEAEARTLKALDTLIDTEEKHDEGLFDLDYYSWAFGPTAQGILDGVEADNKEMAKSLAEFRGRPEGEFLNRTAVNPIQVIGSMDAKSEVLDAMTNSNPIEKAAGYYYGAGFVPDDVMKDYEKAMAPLNEAFEAAGEVESILNDLPAEKPEGWTEEQWEVLTGGPPESNFLEYAEVAGKWILSLGLPLAGTLIGSYAGHPLAGAAVGTAVSPDMPIQETLDLMDEDTRAFFEQAMATNPYLYSLAGLGVKGAVSKSGDLEKVLKDASLSQEQINDIVEKDVKNRGAGLKGLKDSKMWKFIKGAGRFAMKHKLLTGMAIIGGPTFLMRGDNEGAVDTNVVDDPVVINEEVTTVSPEKYIDDRPPEEVTEGPSALDEFQPGKEEETSDIDKFIADNLFLDPELGTPNNPVYKTLPDPLRLDDETVYQGISFGGGMYTGDGEQLFEGAFGSPQFIPGGSTINPKAVQKIQVGGAQMTMMEYIGIVAAHHDLPPELLYGMINHETGQSWNPNKRANDPKEDSWGLAQINMASFGEGTENPGDHIPGGHSFVSRELAQDPRYAIQFLAHNVRRIANNNGGNILAGVIGHRGGPRSATHYANHGEYRTKKDSDYIKAVVGYAGQIGYFSDDSWNVGVKREWDPFSPTPTEAVNLFVDDLVDSMLGVKASQSDYDEWGPKFLEAEKNVYEATQLAKDKGEDYKGLSISQKLDSEMEETGEYKFRDEKQNYQTVQDWFSKQVLPTLGDLT